MTCYCKRSVTLPHGIIGRSAVCVWSWYFLIILTYFLASRKAKRKHVFASLLWIICVISVLRVCLLMPFSHLLASWLSFVMSNCEVVTFPLVSWVRCGARLYRFLIFASFFTLNTIKYSLNTNPSVINSHNVASIHV